MQKSLIKLLWAFAVLMLCKTAFAVGMGGIQVSSALGQPIKADIELVAVNSADKSSLVARLATPEAYKSAGLEYPFGNIFKVEIANRANGEPYLKVSSVQPVNDPFVNMLIELTWSSGKLLREYTFLLDPPGYAPERPAPATIQAVAPVLPPAATVLASEPVVVSVDRPVENEMPIAGAEAKVISEMPEVAVTAYSMPGESVMEPEPVVTARRPSTTQAATAMSGALSGNTIPANKEWLVVERGDTMTKIAERYKFTNISLERMLVALYRANINVFDGKNMNRIRAGKILHLPKPEDLTSVTQSEAKREIRAQAVDWNAYRQKLAGAASVGVASQSTQQIATGKISATVADKTPVAKESAKEVLKLSKGADPEAQVGTGSVAGGASAQDKKNAAQEDAIAAAKALKEEQMRTAMLEKNLQDMQRLAKLKAEAGALAQVQPPPSAPAQVVVPPVTIATPLAEARKPIPPAQPITDEPALLDQILDEPLYLGGGAAILLAILGAVYMRERRKKKSVNEDADSVEIGDDFVEVAASNNRMTAPVQPSPDTGDFRTSTTTKSEGASQDDYVDPISEADLFLNFGRDAQAEEILKEALKNTPKNHQIHLKLLSIYATRKDSQSFAEVAQLLKDSGDEQAWQAAAAMGLEMEPSNPLYGGTGEQEDAQQTQQVTTALKTPQRIADEKPEKSPTGLDFDFDLDALSGNTSAENEAEQDFLGASNTISTQADDIEKPQPTTMDFDVTAAASSSTSDSSVPAETTSLNDLIFNIKGSQASMAEAQPEITQPAPAPAHADADVMEFTIDLPEEVMAKPEPVAQAAESEFSSISLNLDESPAQRSTAVADKDDNWQEVATKLDLAKAYQEMGDADGVREILAEVLNEGDAEQQEIAKVMLKQIS